MRLPSSLLLPLVAASLSVPVGFAGPAAAAGDLDVAQLVMGQGDAALVRAPCGEIALLDAGVGSFDDVIDQLAAWGASGVDELRPAPQEQERAGFHSASMPVGLCAHVHTCRS